MLKDIFDYYKISHQNSYIQQQIKVNKENDNEIDLSNEDDNLDLNI